MKYLTEKQQAIVHDLGYENDLDFLNHFPFRYEYRVTIPFNEWKEGDEVVFEGTLLSAFKSYRFGKNQTRTTFEVLVDEEIISVVIFNRPYLKQEHYAQRIIVHGTYNGKFKFLAKSVTNQPLEQQLGIKPVYATKQGIKQFEITRLIQKILNHVELKDIIPQDFVAKYRLLHRQTALKYLHMPDNDVQIQAAYRTLKYEEFLMYQLYGQMNQMNRLEKSPLSIDQDALNAKIKSLPYLLTADQLIALEDIVKDLKAPRQMNRLLQGDVGSGKTVVAVLAALCVIKQGYQVCFMVPTDVLMEQHVLSIKQLIPEVKIASLSQSTSDKPSVMDAISKGDVDLIIGTHALFQEKVSFKKLGLIIIDEQHRFGVRQRESLINKSDKPDILLLSATPIPRTLAASLFFDLDVSTIETYPSFRKPINTVFIEENSMRSIMDDVHDRLSKKEQIYIVCPAIEESTNMRGVRTVSAIYDQMVQALKGYRIGMLHGQMKAQEKDDIMKQFKQGSIDVLVCTTVIEVGIDVHNANTMIIYNAELFGLATLHQLRGRVGRGAIQGVCYLLSDNKDDAKKRLELMTHVNNGFDLSLEDLRNRGMGDLLGSRQSGIPNFILGDVVKDVAILNQAKLDAHEILHHPHNQDYKNIIDIVRINKNGIDGV
ncbi:ATP-dependent DNA helicase RecG [Erysipelothrix larvae]|uniref:ATP-dependent DNA helicase RecG n=1 Tax=Erysipelothrix larvae TaxID=1514105 RepID=A0A109UGZ3_9FIRM|nr:ATP-dependent DNA helicase RecG [Erysipelothrix larvae]AMC93318.1 ATP-dependent DNA helicase RecG [Erysipelothrix larvae]